MRPALRAGNLVLAGQVWGRANIKVRHDLLQLALDVPDDDALLAWAADPFKAQAGEVVFYNATQLVALETIAFASAQCVGYH